MVQGAAYNDNWDLGYSRAKRVLDRLVKAEVNPAQLSVVSRSEFMPKVSENPDSKETRAENRRIEFIVVADAADSWLWLVLLIKVMLPIQALTVDNVW